MYSNNRKNIVAKKKFKGPIYLFYALALAFSGPFFYWRSILHWRGYQGPEFLKTVAYMWGPGLAGIICFLLFRKSFSKKITLWGTSFFKSFIVWFGPFLLLSMLGIMGQNGERDHFKPLLIAGMGFFTIWGEEIGWRWFLQDYLGFLKPLRKYIIIGVLWEFWHFRFLERLQETPLSFIFMTFITLLIVVALSIAIGFVVDRTKSVAFGAAIHGWVNMVSEIPQQNTYIVFAVLLVFVAFVCFRKDKLLRNLSPSSVPE